MTSRDRWLLPDGIEELLPQQAELAEQLRREVLDLFKVWGYQLVMPTLVEFADSLLVGSGEDFAHHSFRLTDQISGKLLAIRPDITAQVARLDAHSMKATGINRLCYAGSVLHALPKSLSASRCPILAGAEIYGDSGVDADIETVSLMLGTLQKIDTLQAGSAGQSLHHLTLDIGHVTVYKSLEAEIRRRCPTLGDEELASIFEAVQRKSAPDLAELVPGLIDDQQLAQIVLSLPSLCGEIAVLDRAASLLEFLGEPVAEALLQIRQLAAAVGERYPAVTIYLDLAELRGYAYHTGLVFAAYADGFGAALANGGRYDELGRVFGAPRPATGFNTDIKTLVNLLDAEGRANIDRDCIASPSYQSVGDDQTRSAALWQIVDRLRSEGETVVFASGQALEKYSRRLVYQSGKWQVQHV